MENIWNFIVKTYQGAFAYFGKLLSNPFDFQNPFYLLIYLSLAVWLLEIIIPWRKNQKIIRKDFWLDSFYMFFNFFIFNLIIYALLSKTVANGFSSLMSVMGLPAKGLIDLSWLAPIWIIIVYFLISDLLQWCVHNLLHRIPFLWKFHKLHHSVLEMGFAAHLRFHWGEILIYNIFKYIFLAWFFNFSLPYAFYVYSLALLIGHLNHANLGWSYGPLKYIFNNPKMHIWHHSKVLPETHPKGMNFGISLSIWDYIFKTNYIPFDGRDIQLGFDKVEDYPENFLVQQVQPFKENE